MKAHTKLLLSLALAMFAGALLPSCVGAPKSVQEFVEMSDEEFTAWTARVAAHADVASTIALKEDPNARKDLERLCAIVEGDTLTLHADDWLGPFVPLLMLEIDAMLRQHGGVPAGTWRMVQVFEALKAGVRQALDRKEVGP